MALGYLDDSKLYAIADAIRSKTGKAATMTVDDMPDEIESISGGGGGGGGSVSDPIRFIDYDGTVVASYKTVPESLPDNPQHDGLVSQGWNYTLAQVRAQFEDSGTCDVGQMYVTKSGDTEIDITVQDGRLSPCLAIALNGTATIDWGDGSELDTVTGTSLTTRKQTQHIYSDAGNYTIIVHVSSGSADLFGTSTYPFISKNVSPLNANRVYASCAKAVRIGSNMGIGEYAFAYCGLLASVTIPDEVTTIGRSAFNYCASLTSMTIPSGVTAINSNMFDSCCSLKYVSMPVAVQTISSNTFTSCYSLESLAIPSYITAISSTAFNGCRSLTHMVLPNGLDEIQSQMFYACYSLNSVTIPSGVTSIRTQAFGNCYGLGEIHFQSITPPSVDSNSAWTSIPTDCKIYVPTGTLSAYMSATNYPSSSSYTYLEE